MKMESVVCSYKTLTDTMDFETMSAKNNSQVNLIIDKC